MHDASCCCDLVQDKRGEPLDEEHVTKAHHEAYSGGGASGLSASALGGAAALEVSGQ